MRRLASIGLVLALVGAAAPARAGRLPRYGGDVRVQLAAVPASLDPLRLGGDDGALVAECVYEGLTRWDGADLGPGLARQWVRDDDGRRWRFTLRNDVEFHDGTRCDAAAVRQSLERLADPRVSPHAWMLSALVGWDDFAAGRASQIEGLDVPENEQIELAFVSPVPDLPARLATSAASIARRRGDDWIGTGPFQVLASSPGELRLAAFKDHHAGRPFLDHVNFVTRREADKTLVDAAIEMARVLVAEPMPAGTIRWRAPAERLGLALVQPRSQVLGSDAVRRKLVEGFDRGVFVRAVLGGDGEATEDVSPSGPKTVTNRAGEPPGDLGNRPQQHARIIVAASEPVLRALGERLQVHLYALGLAADLDVLPADGFAQALAEHSYDVVVLGWTPPQPRPTALDAATRTQWLSSSLLHPVLGDALPDGWSPARLASAKDPEQVLVRGGLCIPLVFFHDLWQTTAEVLDLQMGTAGAGLGLANAHLEPHNP